MTDQKFEYDEALLEECALSRLVARVTQASEEEIIDDPKDQACWIIFQQHTNHYGRPVQNDRTNHENYRVSPRFRRFLNSVKLVYEHNNKNHHIYNQHERRLAPQQQHTIGLNQFADEDYFSSLETQDDWQYLWETEDWETEQLGVDGPVLKRLFDADSIEQVTSERLFTHHHNHHMHGKHRKHHHDDKNIIHTDNVNHYAAMEVAQDNEFVIDKGDADMTTDDQTDSASDADFDTYVNWATEDNPDGVSIVHTVSDQGACGSCWAFAATGSLEASASRRVAFQAYTDYVKASLGQEDDVTRDSGVAAAQEAERNSIQIANLSVQELVDCDTYADQGCTGGNPLLAFYFIHRFGLTSTQRYPYVGQQELCKIELVASPIATVDSWGILTSNHEDNMALVLRYIGPIAVGVNGADPSFLAYEGGIFESQDCDQGANHALLIVGYGQEEDAQGNTVKYWICRNSWGSGWGEDGYVRVRRGEGSKGVQGVCGIARSPSVALGGTLLPESGIKTTLHVDIIDRANQSQRLETSLVHSYCDVMGLGSFRRSCSHIEGVVHNHRTLVYCCITLLLSGILVVWPFARRRQRERELARVEIQSEESPLVGLDRDATDTYGIL